MAEVEDVTGTAPRAVEDVLHARADIRRLREKHGGVEVPLHRDVVADGGPARVEVNAPVEPDHVAARRAHEREQRRGASPEMNRGNAGRQRADERACVGHDERAVVVRRQHADPRVEDLHGLGARRDLAVQVARRRLREDLQQAVPRLGLLVHEPLGVEVLARRPALDDVGRDRERRPGEADEGNAPRERLLHAPHGLEHEGHGGLDVDPAEPRDVALAPHGPADHGPLALRELEPHAERLDDQEDVGKEDRRVHAEPVHGLERDRRGGLRVLAELEEAEALAHGAILGEVAARLAHEPHGRERDGFPARGAQEWRIWK